MGKTHPWTGGQPTRGKFPSKLYESPCNDGRPRAVARGSVPVPCLRRLIDQQQSPVAEYNS